MSTHGRATAVRKEGGVEVRAGNIPVARIRGNAKNESFFRAAVALKPGEWFVWPKAPTNHKATTRKWAAASGKKIESFMSIDGAVVVCVRNSDDFIEDDEPERPAGRLTSYPGEEQGDDDNESEVLESLSR